MTPKSKPGEQCELLEDNEGYAAPVAPPNELPLELAVRPLPYRDTLIEIDVSLTVRDHSNRRLHRRSHTPFIFNLYIFGYDQFLIHVRLLYTRPSQHQYLFSRFKTFFVMLSLLPLLSLACLDQDNLSISIIYRTRHSPLVSHVSLRTSSGPQTFLP